MFLEESPCSKLSPIFYVSEPALLPSLTPPACLMGTFLTLLGILFGTVAYRETLPNLASYRSSSSLLTLRVFSPTHKRNSSSLTNMSDTDTLVGDPEALDSPSAERLLAKMPQGVDGPGLGVLEEDPEWTFNRLIRHRPVQILSITMFLNQFVGGAWSAGSLLFFYDKFNGLGMSAQSIGTALAVNGFWSIACQLIFLTRIRRYFGISNAFKLLTFGWIIVWIFLPMLRPLLEWVETPLPRRKRV